MLLLIVGWVVGWKVVCCYEVEWNSCDEGWKKLVVQVVLYIPLMESHLPQ
jgi:hypothetical protein